MLSSAHFAFLPGQNIQEGDVEALRQEFEPVAANKDSDVKNQVRTKLVPPRASKLPTSDADFQTKVRTLRGVLTGKKGNFAKVFRAGQAKTVAGVKPKESELRRRSTILLTEAAPEEPAKGISFNRSPLSILIGLNKDSEKSEPQTALPE